MKITSLLKVNLNSRYRYLTLTLLSFLPLISFCQPPGGGSNWHLFFQDEFSGTSCDGAKWSKMWGEGQHKEWTACRVSTRDENLNYDNHNHVVSNGTLKLITRAEEVSCSTTDNVPKDYHYSSAMIISRETFKYGYYEIRCRLPVIPPGGTGWPFGPNFWFYGAKQECGMEAKSTEIDVFEYKYTQVPPSFVEMPGYRSNVHYEHQNGSFVHDEGDNRHYNAAPGTFHTYGVEWSSSSINYYLDGNLYYSSNMSAYDLMNMNMIIDVNVPMDGQTIVPNTLLPYAFEIDYIRGYKRINSPLPPPSNDGLMVIQANNSLTSYGTEHYPIAGPGKMLVITTGGRAQLGAQIDIAISSLFRVDPGAYFDAYITDFNHQCEVHGESVYARVGMEEEESTFTEEPNNPDVITISPNPNSGVFSVTLPESSDKASSFSVLNTLGKTVYTSRTVSERNELDLSSLEKGIYYINIYYSSGKTVSRKIIVQ